MGTFLAAKTTSTVVPGTRVGTRGLSSSNPASVVIACTALSTVDCAQWAHLQPGAWSRKPNARCRRQIRRA
eukprot:4058419-Pyramimonas_sp.AAC.1